MDDLAKSYVGKFEDQFEGLTADSGDSVRDIDETNAIEWSEDEMRGPDNNIAAPRSKLFGIFIFTSWIEHC